MRHRVTNIDIAVFMQGYIAFQDKTFQVSINVIGADREKYKNIMFDVLNSIESK